MYVVKCRKCGLVHFSENPILQDILCECGLWVWHEKARKIA
jgi:hypothetical protein